MKVLLQTRCGCTQIIDQYLEREWILMPLDCEIPLTQNYSDLQKPIDLEIRRFRLTGNRDRATELMVYKEEKQ
jgi:hypothetical protein